jgi:hypothetical protein
VDYYPVKLPPVIFPAVKLPPVIFPAVALPKCCTAETGVTVARPITPTTLNAATIAIARTNIFEFISLIEIKCIIYKNFFVLPIKNKLMDRGQKLSVPQETEPDIASIQNDQSDRVEIRHTPPIRGGFLELQKKGLRIKYYRTTEKE